MPETIFFRAASLAPASFNRSAGTVSAILSTGSGVQRRGANGMYTEKLSIVPGAWSLRVPRPPLLDSHRQDSIERVLGHVADIRTEAGAIVGVLHITRASILDQIEAGSLSALSVGYTVSSWTESDNGRVRTASTWMIHEASFVAEGADVDARLRSNDMPEPIVDTGNTPAPVPAVPATMTRTETTAATRALCTTLGLPAAWADGQIDAGADLVTMRSNAMAELEKRTTAGGMIRVHQVGDSNDDPIVRIKRQGEALASRMSPSLELPKEAAQYRGLSLTDHARLSLMARNEPGVQFMSRETLLQRAITTGDLPTLLVDSGNRVLMQAYAAAPNPLKALARQVTAPDFRKRSTVRLGELSQLERVAENGEIKSGGVAEASESFKLETYAKTFGLTRQALINDDLGAFSDVNGAMGRAAAESEAGLLVALLVQSAGLGPLMGDGIRLFNAGHGNLAGSGAVISVASLSAGRLAMRVQKGTDGVTPINSTAKYLVVSPTKETEAEQAVAAIYAATPPTSNPFSGRLTVVVEPRLTGNAWYLWSDPAVMPAMEFAYLASAPGPQLASREGWDVLGMEFRCVLDFGCGMTDWRGIYRNPGA